ncbi:PREDICTED: uncharacterized protein ycf45 isoform X1 [Fragaria vesca subsp. vesca]|uniref:uncharacterized protein ycf45 isoform X1 n=2 Tax=Fragaria vesca subsp. vesca TaxID=101020 RepID=UPI0002C31322|nr:PREDICTED: uncharacterized protein ycf45 isoform X1 [Fragaria vesca subsp. vesca]XP_011458257.1 PREDICTED: uncharacterized protein ycf45 isoform X1 [Fragaria vesca subsp. vesca]
MSDSIRSLGANANLVSLCLATTRKYNNNKVYFSCTTASASHCCLVAHAHHHPSRVQDDLPSLLQILPHDLHDHLLNESRRSQLLEVILDLGRFPEARYVGEPGGQYLRTTVVSLQELEHAQEAVRDFGGDNRAGIEGTLHRISAIRSRNGMIVGLTCRVGRAVSGHSDMVFDLLQYGKSILFVGKPGVGKTTILREIARVLSDEFHKRVVIVDTSNEIAGDGNIPHAAIGGARRMQVAEPSMQYKVMIEAVENHMPEVIIVDEIGTETEALACRSIAQRGVMLIATAHGQQIENIIKNPTLSDLIGGVKTVTLGDEEAKARKRLKTILERQAAPTFEFLIEMRHRHYWVTHQTEKSVDMLLRGKSPQVEVRTRDDSLKVVIERSKAYDKCDA